MITPTLILLAACGSNPASKAAPDASSTPEAASAEAPTAASEADGRKRAPVLKNMPDVARARAGRPAVALPPDEPTLGDQYLVILASKLDPEEVKPAIEAVKARAEISSSPRVLLSSRFKNLMPCYTVGIADAFADKKAAFALSKKLTAAGVDNYVKNAGPYVGPSPTLDAFCASASAEPAESEIARPLRVVNGGLWMPTGEELPKNMRLAAPKAMDDTYSAWIQAIGDPSPSAWRAVNVETGQRQDCNTRQDAILTLGTPHFGTLQGDEKPTEPSCGMAERYAELDCAGEGEGWLAVPAQANPVAYKASPAPALVAAATADLKALPEWSSAAVLDGEEPPVKTVTVTRYDGAGGTFFLVEGKAEAGSGVCGGDDVQLRALYAAQGEGLGRRLGPFHEARFSSVLGVVDVEGDGAPELYLAAFPGQLHLVRANGDPVFEQEIAYCDCPC